MINRQLLLLVALLFLPLYSLSSRADEVLVAVAANFTAPMKQLARGFAEDTPHSARLSFGATGSLYAQISNGAPFDVFLSADDKTTTRLATENNALADSEFTYARGTLVLWSKDPGRVNSQGHSLAEGAFNRLAMANPRTAPYGKATQEYLTGIGLYNALKPKLVTGNNISQTFQFVSSGNAEIGFVALSQVYRNGTFTSGSAWLVPTDSYSPIRQNAILLKQGEGNAAAHALLEYLKSDKARAVIESFGYEFNTPSK